MRLVFLVLLFTAQAAVIGIDLGSEFFKISLIQPGKKLEIVENVQSSRTTPTLIAFTEDARLMGAEAHSRASTKPDSVLPFFLRLLGVAGNDTQARNWVNEEFITMKLEEDEARVTLKAVVREQKFSMEDLVAMIFELAKSMSEIYSKGAIKDCAVTVPPYWTRTQRQLLIQTAEAAKLHVLSLVHENTAAALYYGVDRNDTETPHYALFYNLGASKLQVTLARYTAVQKKFSVHKTVENIEVLAHAWDEEVGGNRMDAILAGSLADAFMKKTNINPRTSPKSMLTLLSQSNKAKRVLSASKTFHVFLDPFMQGQALNVHLDRANFEELLQPITKKLIKPIESVLKEANLTISEIDSLEIIGGVTRIPKIQEILKDFYGKELGQHLNGDEAMAHGTALFAANLTRDIQVKPIWLSDVLPYAVRMKLVGKEGDMEKGAEIIKKWGKLGGKKLISVTYSKSLTCTLIAEYPTGDMPILAYNITGVEEFAKKHSADPVIYLTFGVDSSGIPGLVSAEARVEIVENEPENSENTTGNSTESDGNDTENEENKPEKAPETESEAKPQKKKVKKLALDISSTNIELPSPLSLGGVKLTAARLISLAKEDAERRKTAEARSELESYIYYLREKLEEETFRKVTTEGEREKLEKLLEDTREWLDSPDFHTAAHSTVEDRKSKLEKTSKDAEERENEYIKREEAISDAYKQLKSLNSTMKDINETRAWVSQADKDEAFKKINEVTEWLDGKIKEQQTVKPWENPAFKVTQVKNKVAGATKAVDKVKRIQKPKEKTEKTEKTETKKSGKKSNKLPEFFNFGPGMDGSNIKMDNVRIGDEVYNYDPNASDDQSEEQIPETDIREEL